MKFGLPIVVLALAVPAAAIAQAPAETRVLAWHPNGKTPAAIAQPRSTKSCVEAANHHRGSKGVVTPVVRCTNTAMARLQATPQTVERGE